MLNPCLRSILAYREILVSVEVKKNWGHGGNGFWLLTSYSIIFNLVLHPPTPPPPILSGNQINLCQRLGLTRSVRNKPQARSTSIER